LQHQLLEERNDAHVLPFGIFLHWAKHKGLNAQNISADQCLTYLHEFNAGKVPNTVASLSQIKLARAAINNSLSLIREDWQRTTLQAHDQIKDFVRAVRKVKPQTPGYTDLPPIQLFQKMLIALPESLDKGRFSFYNVKSKEKLKYAMSHEALLRLRALVSIRVVGCRRSKDVARECFFRSHVSWSDEKLFYRLYDLKGVRLAAAAGKQKPKLSRVLSIPFLPESSAFMNGELRKVCAATAIKRYILFTKPKEASFPGVKDIPVFLSLNKSKGKYTGVTPQRLRTIIQPFMKFCGINLEKYKSHVCRAVGASSRVACGQDESTVQSFMILASKKTFHENYLFLDDVLSTLHIRARTLFKASAIDIEEAIALRVFDEALIGRRVQKRFPEHHLTRLWKGTITKLRGVYFHVDFDDGDKEELDWSELRTVLIPLSAKQSKQALGKVISWQKQ